jgi:uncharacterized protein YjbI with pentapeptide repeats
VSDDAGAVDDEGTDSRAKEHTWRKVALSSEESSNDRRLAKITKKELEEKLTAHKRWAAQYYKKWVHSKTETEPKDYERTRPEMSRLDLHGENFRKCDLRGANFQESDLSGADLRECDLRHADLRGCRFKQAQFSDAFGGGEEFNLKAGAKLSCALLKGAALNGALLRGVALQKADLTDAILTDGVDLCFANLRGAILHRAKFTGAALSHVRGLAGGDLEDVNLKGVTGLKGTEFARCDLTGATLPVGIADFAVLRAVEDTSKNAQTAFVSMLLGCLYSWLTIATTIDARLLTNSTSSPLPLIQTEVPIAGFFWVAPVILVASFIWLHLYLQDLWVGLAGLPAIFPDGKPLDQRASPWLLTGLVRPHFNRLKTDRPPLSKVKVGISIVLAWWLVPATAVWFWLRYLPRHHWLGTSLHLVVVVVSIACAIWFQHLAKRTLRGELRGSVWPPSKGVGRLLARLKDLPVASRNAVKRTWRLALSGILVLLVALVVSDGAINGIDTQGVVRSWSHRVIVPNWLLPAIRARAFATLSEADVSTRAEGWLRAGPVERLEMINSAQLRGADLRYASAGSAFLARADLREANLRGADLRGANLQHANFAEASLAETKLEGTDLRNADLSQARGLTQQQLNQACVDGTTRLPGALAAPTPQRDCTVR